MDGQINDLFERARQEGLRRRRRQHHAILLGCVAALTIGLAVGSLFLS